MEYTRLRASSLFPLYKPSPSSSLNQRVIELRNQKLKMGKGVSFLLLAVLLCYGVTATMGYKGERGRRERERWEEKGTEDGRERERAEEGREGEDLFLFPKAKTVMRTDAGEMRMVKSLAGRIVEKPLHIGFITMEPQTLFIPQYLDSSLILFVRTGEARVGCIFKDEMVERRLKIGDVYLIPAGSTFYILNPGEGQRLHIICSIDPSESLQLKTFQSFFIGGGTYPQSILAGFGPETLATALNVSVAKVMEMFTRQQEGPIVYLEPHAPSIWKKFSQLQEKDRLNHLKRMIQEESHQQEEEKQTPWSWRKLFGSFFGGDHQDSNIGKKAPDSFNLYKRSPDFSNDYGWSIALGGSDYKPLKHSGIGIYLVNLTAGAMMAPHVNPRATEYGIVLRGTGRIQIVYPNGSLALDSKVKEGDVFWVPRYFAFCQIASRIGPFEFFGFTTSSHKNRPQFLVGANSLLHHINTPELAASFSTSEERITSVINAQREAVILPSAEASPPEEGEHEHEHEKEKPSDKEKPREKERENFEAIPNVVKTFSREMIMGFD